MTTRASRAGCLFAALMLLASGGSGGCGVTEAANPEDDGKPGTKPAALGSLVLRLASFAIPQGARLDVSLRARSGGQEVTRRIDAAAGLVRLDELEAGRYDLSLVATTSDRQSRHLQLVDVSEGEPSPDELTEEAIRAKACEGLEQAKALPRFAAFTTEKTGDLPADTKLHVVSAYEAMGKDCPGATREGQPDEQVDGNRYGVIRVRVQEPDVALYLSSYEPVLWWVDVEPGASVRGITLSGYYASNLVGVPEGITSVRRVHYPVVDETTTYIQNLEPSYMPTYDEASQSWVCSDQPTPVKEGDYEGDLALIKSLTGLAAVTSVQTLYQGATFVVNADTREHLTSSIREAGHCYKDADGVVRQFTPPL